MTPEEEDDALLKSYAKFFEQERRHPAPRSDNEFLLAARTAIEFEHETPTLRSKHELLEAIVLLRDDLATMYALIERYHLPFDETAKVSDASTRSMIRALEWAAQTSHDFRPEGEPTLDSWLHYRRAAHQDTLRLLHSCNEAIREEEDKTPQFRHHHKQ